MKRPVNKKVSQSVLIKRKLDTILDNTNQMDTIEEKKSFHQWYMKFWDDQLAKEFRWFAKEEAEKVKREMIKELEKAEAKAEKAAEESAQKAAEESTQKVIREMTKRLEEAEAETERLQKKRDNGIVHLIQTGVSLQLLADSFRLTMEEVRQIAREYGIDPVEV